MKKILVLLILFLHMDFAFGQITCIDSETIFSKLGVEISYCTVSLGSEGVCKKYKVTIYERNSSDQIVTIEGGELYIDPRIGLFPAAGTCGKREEYASPDGIIWINFPWINANGLRTEIPPNSNFQKSFIVYTKDKIPDVGVRYIYARHLKDKSSSTNKNNNSQTPNSNANSKERANTQTNGNNSSQQNQSNSVEDTNAEINNLNQYLTQIPDTDSEKQRIMREAKTLNDNANLTDASRASKLKNLTAQAKRRAEQLGNSVNNSSNSDLESLHEEKRQLCGELYQFTLTEELQKVRDLNCGILIVTGTDDSNFPKLKEQIRNLRNAVNQAKSLTNNGSENNRKNAVKEKEDKAATERDNNFKSYYEKGMDNYNSKNYDGAINNLQTSLNYAVNDRQKTHVQDWIAKIREEKRLEAEAAARKVRIEERQKQEAATNAATGTALAAVGSLMALMNDSYTQKPFAARYYLGFGMENLILNVNDFTKKQSDIQSTLPLVFIGGLNFTLFNNKNVNWVINPHFRYNQIFAAAGEAGSGYGVGINTHLSVGFNKDSPFRFFGEYQYNGNVLDFSYDTDVASGGTTATDAVYEGYYELLSQRIGGGIILRFNNGDRETFIKPGYFIDNLSLLGIKRNFVSLEMYFASAIGVELAYSKNYVSLGDVDFPNSSKMKSAIKDPIATDYWTLKFYRRGLFGKK